MIWLTLATGVLLPVAAFAQTVTMELQQVVSAELVSGHGGHADFVNEEAGPYGLQVISSSGFGGSALNAGEMVYLFCVEIGQHMPYRQEVTWSLVNAAQADTRLAENSKALSANIPLTGIGDSRSHNLERLYGHVFGGTYNIALLTGDQQSAFQLAVWELAQDDNFLLTTIGTDPLFWITDASPATLAIAQSWLDAVAANPSGPTMSLMALNNGVYQDYLIPSALVAIPEPSTYAAALGIAAGILVLRRRLKRAV